jgi:hypothetical protein
MIKTVLALALAAGVNAECPNACSGHGDCTNYDQCFCYRNWESADCSLRTCAFGLAHVDSPMGDLDSSADSLSGPDKTILLGSTKYPLGVTEQFPNMTSSSGEELEQTAHYYMECSNKGICDRKAGECECFDGYEGNACQRASCPNECSGHGTCEHVKTLAALDFDNLYDLWDAEMTMGCQCDPGYSGPDCSTKDCKYGIDPLYVDDDATARVEGVTYRVNHTVTDASYTEDGKGVISGTYALKFYDAFGEDYTTMPIPHDANCYTVEDALDGLPNTVIPDDSVVCHNRDGRGLVGQGYSLTFRGNPGYLKQLFVDTYLDGDRPTVTGGIYGDLAVNVEIFNEGMTGEFTDYFATQCQNVYGEVKANSVPSSPAAGDLWGAANLVSTFPAAPFRELNSGYYLYLDVVETKLLKQCLGDSDGFEDDNVEVYDWDYGSILSDDGINLMMGSYPHAIKLVQKDPYDDYQGGMYYLTWWESSNKKFVLANIPSANMIGEEFAVYVTDGVVERVIVDTELSNNVDYTTFYATTAYDTEEYEAGDSQANIAELGRGHREFGNFQSTDERVTAYFSRASNILYTSYDTACETAYFAVEPCLDKGDMLFIIDSYYMSVFYDPSQKNGKALTSEGVDLASLVADAPPLANYESGNLYTIKKIYKEDPTSKTWDREDRYRIILDKNIPFAGTAETKFQATNATDGWQSTRGIVSLFKFSPATTGNYDFVAPCSNRGICDEGSCECFKGYTDDNCDIQSSLAV